MKDGRANKSASVFSFLAGLALIVIDQAVKYFVFALPAVQRQSKLIYFTQFKNNQFAFSIPLPAWAIFSIYGVVLILLASFVYKHYANFRAWDFAAWTLIFAGSASNIFERIVSGHVRDFIGLYGGGIINLADIYIILGILILVLGKKER